MGYTHGTRWTDELVKQKVRECMEALGLDRMPSSQEMKDYFKDNRLTNVIAKKYGFYNLAAEMNLEAKGSETLFGKTYEAKAAEILRAEGFAVRRMSTRHPYDLLVDDCVKIDVKASRLYSGKNGNFYTFNTEKPFATCDFYLLFLVDDDLAIIKILVVPSSLVVSNNQISIGEQESKYYRFKNRFDLIRSAVKFWKQVV